MNNLCREYTILRSEEASRARGWILGNTKIGPVLDVKVCLHQKRDGLEIMVESWSINSSRRWWSSTLWRYYGRIKAKFDGTSQWSFNDWITCLAKGGGPNCVNPNSSKHFLYLSVIQGHSGGNIVDLALQDNVLLPEDFTEYIYHVGNVSEIRSTIRSGLIPGGRSLQRDRQSVFFTAVNPMDDDQSMEEIRCDLDKPRIAPKKNTRRLHQNTVYWCNLKLAQKKGVQIYQTRSHAIVLHNTTCDMYWESGMHED